LISILNRPEPEIIPNSSSASSSDPSPTTRVSDYDDANWSRQRLTHSLKQLLPIVSTCRGIENNRSDRQFTNAVAPIVTRDESSSIKHDSSSSHPWNEDSSKTVTEGGISMLTNDTQLRSAATPIR
jgi:hypothetical protein